MPLQVAPLSKLRPTKIVVAARSSSQTVPDLSTATSESNPAVAFALKMGCEYSNVPPLLSDRQKSMPPGMPPSTAGPPTGAEMYTLLLRLSTALEGSPSPRVEDGVVIREELRAHAREVDQVVVVAGAGGVDLERGVAERGVDLGDRHVGARARLRPRQCEKEGSEHGKGATHE